MENVFIPFGAQYYRAPTPVKSDWDKDLRQFKEYGFNTIKIWAQWRWNNPQEGKYYFDDLDELMDIARKYCIKVIINIIFDVAPAWFCKKYPESVMVTWEGRRIEPQTTAWRQVGGTPGPCYNHDEGKRIRMEFLAETVKRYKDHPALYLWDLWNEPELTCGILREPVLKDMVCYCPNCTSRFIKWLEHKYGTIEELNKGWNRNYNGWDEVEIPRSGQTFNDMIDWRMFFAHTLTEELRSRVDTAKAVDGKTPMMVHTVPMPYFNAVNACNNDYELADLCDIFGNSAGSSPFAAAFNTSCADGKRVINAEIHAYGGNTYNRPALLSFEDVKSHLYIPLARGVKGFIYWQYKPEALGWEGPAWGMTAPDGGPTDILKHNVEVCRVLQENAGLIDKVMPVPSRIAVLNSYKNQVFDWCVNENVDMYCSSVIGNYMALYNSNLNADIVGLDSLSYSKLKQYSVILCPFPYYMNSKVASLLKQWVSEGGCLISEAFFGSTSEDTGLHSQITPGFGFTDVFGAREGVTVTASFFNNAYCKKWSDSKDERYLTLTIAGDQGYMAKGDTVQCYYFMEELLPDTADVLASFDNGKTAVTVNKYGKGKAIMAGSLLGYAYAKTGSKKLADFISTLAEMGDASRTIAVEGGKVRVDLLKNDDAGEALLVVNSFDENEVRLKVKVNGVTWKKSKIINLHTGGEIPVVETRDGFTVDLCVIPKGHELYELR